MGEFIHRSITGGEFWICMLLSKQRNESLLGYFFFVFFF